MRLNTRALERTHGLRGASHKQVVRQSRTFELSQTGGNARPTDLLESENNCLYSNHAGKK